jgi:hypothetical protein
MYFSINVGFNRYFSIYRGFDRCIGVYLHVHLDLHQGAHAQLVARGSQSACFQGEVIEVIEVNRSSMYHNNRHNYTD